MGYHYADPVNIKVEIQINGVWTTVTSRARSAGDIVIRRGRSDGAIQGETSTCALTLGNDDGAITEGNPLSIWYPYIGRGTPLRVSLTGILPSDAQRFEGEIEEMLAVYPGGPSSSMRIFATGSLGVAAQNDDPLDSAMYRTSINNDGVVPVAYWSMEDQSSFDSLSTTYFAQTQVEAPAWSWSLPGTGPAMESLPNVPGVSELPTPAGDSSLRGSLPVPSFVSGVFAGARVPSHTNTGKWAFGAARRIPDVTSFGGLLRVIYSSQGTVSPVPLVGLAIDIPNADIIIFYNPDATAGGSTFTATAAVDIEAAQGDWIYATLMSENASSGSTDRITATVRDSAGTLLGTVTMLTNTTTHQSPQWVEPLFSNGVTGAQSAAHAVLYTDAAFTIGTHDVNLARSMHGWEGEQAHERLARLAAQENLAITITGSVSAQMGSQRVASLFDLFMDCERADQGLLGDSGSVTYRCLDDLYNQDPQVEVVHGSLTTDHAPTWDNQHVTNDWTLSQINGATARVSDEDHVTRSRRRLKGALTVNTYPDSVLPDHAGFRVAKGTAPGPRYSSGGINLRNAQGCLLAEAVLDLVPGDRLLIADTALKSQHPPYGADQIIIGWVEYLDVDMWEFYPVTVPYSPYAVGIAGDGVDGGGWPQTGPDAELASPLAIGATSMSVTVDGAPFSTTADLTLSPLTLIVGGERLPVTAISGAGPGQTFTVTRTLAKAHAAGDTVQVFLPLYATL
jgi:hypothetical protein